MQPEQAATQSFGEWVVTQPDRIQLAFFFPGFLLDAWYKEGGQDARRTLHLVTSRMGLGGSEVTLGVHAYLHLIHGDYPSFPAAAREFLASSPELVIPVLRAVLQDRLSTSFEIRDQGPIDPEEIDNVVTLLTNGVIFPREAVERVETEVDALLLRLPTTIISEAAEAHARRYLDSGEVTVRHPAHEFLTILVEHAPNTRKLPARAAALTALIGPPQE